MDEEGKRAISESQVMNSVMLSRMEGCQALYRVVIVQDVKPHSEMRMRAALEKRMSVLEG